MLREILSLYGDDALVPGLAERAARDGLVSLDEVPALREEVRAAIRQAWQQAAERQTQEAASRSAALAGPQGMTPLAAQQLRDREEALQRRADAGEEWGAPRNDPYWDTM